MFHRSKENLLALGFPVFEDETEGPINDAFLALAKMFGDLDGNGQRTYIPRLLEAFNAFCSGNDLMTYNDDGSMVDSAEEKAQDEYFEGLREKWGLDNSPKDQAQGLREAMDKLADDFVDENL